MLRLRDSTPRSASLATLQSNALSMAAEELSVLTVVSLLTSPQTVTLSSTALRELDTLPRLTSQLWELPRSKLRDNDLPLESEQLRMPIEISRWGTNTWNQQFEGARLKAVLCAPVNLECPKNRLVWMPRRWVIAAIITLDCRIVCTLRLVWALSSRFSQK